LPLHNHKNIGEVQKTAYLVGIVTAVDSEFDTVDFTGVGTCPSGVAIPLFYHCQYEEGEEPALRDNGALEGAAGAFSKDDEVIVQCEITGANRYVPLRVMGFTDKPKPCLWEPWGGPDIDSKHPWDQYVIPSDLTPWTLKRTEEKGGFLEHDVTASSPSYTLLQFLNIPEADRPTIPNQEIYFNISSTLSPPLAPNYYTSWMQFQITDENGTKKDLFFANNKGSHVPSAWPPWKDAIWIGDNDGKEPISIAPLTGKIKSVFYEGNIHVGIHAFYQSEFINFK
jgi:hypothetical protein